MLGYLLCRSRTPVYGACLGICYVGQGHRFMVHAWVFVMQVKDTGLWCMLEESVKDNYFARFHTHSYHCCMQRNALYF